MKSFAVVEGVYLDPKRSAELGEIGMEGVVLKMAMFKGGAEKVAKIIDDAGHMAMMLTVEPRELGVKCP